MYILGFGNFGVGVVEALGEVGGGGVDLSLWWCGTCWGVKRIIGCCRFVKSNQAVDFLEVYVFCMQVELKVKKLPWAMPNQRRMTSLAMFQLQICTWVVSEKAY